MALKPADSEAILTELDPPNPPHENEIWLDMTSKEVVTVINGIEARYKPDDTVFSGYVSAGAYRQGNVNDRKSGK
jgi:hypothetical protein